ncbi:thermopsin precursor related protein, partial [mine drainage metagenome]
TTPAAQNPFPQGNVIVWDSTSVLIRGNHFTTETVPGTGCGSGGACVPLQCTSGCVPPDELLLYGGRNNTIWGNTFADPAGVSPTAGAGAVYAGLAEAESGDLVYNNNFSVDNPAMLMAYDIYNDSCWAGYAGQCLPLFTPSYRDTWNVTNQSATDVAATANGFPLSGNVLGPAYRLQGGNYWWNWGSALDPFGTVPYTNVFDYTQNATNLPPGYPAVESSLRVGGDFVPLRLGYFGPAAVNLTFTESGLAAGTLWSVALGGVIHEGTGASIVLSEPAGRYAYSIGAVAGFQRPANGTVTVGSTPVDVPVVFVALPPVTYAVTFTESGLSSGTPWSVTLNGTTNRSATGTIGFSEPSGTYAYSVGAVAGFQRPANGSVTVAAAAVAVALVFAPIPPAAFAVTFAETGLPAGSSWTVSVNGTPHAGTAADQTVPLVNGTYRFAVATTSA